MKKIIYKLKENQYMAYYFIAMFSLDFYLRFINRTMKSYSCLYYIPNLFTVIWLLIFCLILYIVKSKKIKRLFIAFSSTVFLVLMLTNFVFSKIFSKFFTFKDILYAGEGSKFLSSIFAYFKFTDLIIIFIFILLIALSIFTIKYYKEQLKIRKLILSSVLIITIFILELVVQLGIGKPSSTTNWSAFSNRRNVYNQFNDTKRSFMLCGLFEYSIRDFYITFLRPNRKISESDFNEIHEYFESNNKSTSKYNGIFKNKNLILIMLEDIDTWMITKDSMPTLYMIQKNGINFTNHYSANYASGFTFNTEFIANTGLIPNITELKTSYSYNQNNFDYSLANLFKNDGYISNSIHKNKGSFYNRDNMHIAWGYDNHFDYSKLDFGNSNIDLDTTVVINNIDKFIYSKKFMTFWITYSTHMPYTFEKNECKENIDYIKSKFNSTNEEYLCAMSQAKNTDDAIKFLLEELQKENKLNDTVLIFFTDHYAYSMNYNMVSQQKKETDKNLLTRTPFIIYNNGKYIENVNKVNSTVDILPTIADLFGLDYNPKIYFGSSIFSDDYKGLVVFSDSSWYDGDIYYKSDEFNKYDNTDYVSEINKNAKDLLTIGGKVIETDYFRRYNLDNTRR